MPMSYGATVSPSSGAQSGPTSYGDANSGNTFGGIQTGGSQGINPLWIAGIVGGLLLLYVLFKGK